MIGILFFELYIFDPSGNFMETNAVVPGANLFYILRFPSAGRGSHFSTYCANNRG